MNVADDVLLMPPGEDAVRGKNAMRDWYAAFLSQYTTSSLTLSDREVFVGDRWAIELGSYEWGLTPAAGGGDVLDRGNYMQLWKSDADGQWRFERVRRSEGGLSGPPRTIALSRKFRNGCFPHVHSSALESRHPAFFQWIVLQIQSLRQHRLGVSTHGRRSPRT